MRFSAILEVDRALEVCLRDVIIVEDAKGSSRDRQQDERGDKEEDRCEIGFDGSRCDQQLERIQCCFLSPSVSHVGRRG